MRLSVASGDSVLEGDGVGCDVHLRLVLGHLDDPPVRAELSDQIGATGRARAVELGLGRRLATGTRELHRLDSTRAYDRR